MPFRFFDNKNLSYDLQCLRSPEELRKIDLQKLIQKVVTIKDPHALAILSKYVVFDPSLAQKQGSYDGDDDDDDDDDEQDKEMSDLTKTTRTNANNSTVHGYCYVPDKYKHKLISALMKHQYKQLRRTKHSKLFQGIPIPQPPPPRPDKVSPIYVIIS
ncbi:hypothetical protein RFI_34994 [Reticulomyxa filosa]|uniref:Uncharacterized protein n=1 Tax=Reticulomyxa filosa TaxID=46433 RepID=X6LMS7_RETFI|nr:hypothetical protein RFI_34994 [Reticulomyxa filosa]|eukprot:ETO02437.1 hypothetical protein RFI_34994 [Reticulomyxa filosa]